MARLLLQARADPNDRDAKGVCVLHSASFDGLGDLCQSLLKARADANAADQHGQTAFFFAPSSKVCDVLLEGKADVNAVNQKGQSALHLASRAGLSEVLHWMAPRVSHEVMELRDVHGATAAYYARHAGIGYDFLRHKFSAEAAGEDKSEKRTGRNNLEPVESQARERTRSSWTSLARRDLALAPVLEDQLDGEEEEVPVATAAADVEEVPVATAAADVEETPEAPETPEAELPGSSTTVPPEEHQELQALDMEVTSCFLEDCPESPKALETSLAEHEPKEETSTLEAPDRSAPEGSSPASSLERADQMVTWEEDCGCPGFALTASTADLSLVDSPVAEAVGDGNSVASDVSDTASPGKAARSKRRSSRGSLNQVFLRPLDPLKAEKTES
ncbi:unnamed protein product [Cladocopium goreaui]|uniref:Ankyrin repeat domain-containing protein 36C n=1 Tax=Cladocopium goreaui TaxID=2562237 RepID=A0A9P1GR03_9DINO|nr:unnamed protein product [Cladocopium goreaui]